MKEFCKILNSDKYGQVLVMKTTDDGEPYLAITFEPENVGLDGDTFGQITFGSRFFDSEQGRDALDRAYDSVNIEKIEKAIHDTVSALKD